MTATAVAAESAIQQIFAREDHQVIFKVEIDTLDKGLGLVLTSLDVIVHIMLETPCSPPLRVQATRSRRPT